MTSTAKHFLQHTLVLLLLISLSSPGFAPSTPPQPVSNARVAPGLQLNGLLFKDLNKNGKLDVYEDWRRSIAERVNDLVAQMTVEEKAGLRVQPSLTVGLNGGISKQLEDMPYDSPPFSNSTQG